ncbi:unnamed protein product [Anisakis simplex]|uniref:Uncharacterized protein n=1 Tax=Anisakis simplex TaxID=6269 RepID=A0A0M3JSN6_ANISI|nr:unnamed protein product [Anisakis simplex]
MAESHSYIPRPTQFLQEEASDDDDYLEDEVGINEEDDDYEFNQPLIAIKNNSASSTAHQSFSIPSSSFYGSSNQDLMCFGDLFTAVNEY